MVPLGNFISIARGKILMNKIDFADKQASKASLRVGREGSRYNRPEDLNNQYHQN